MTPEESKARSMKSKPSTPPAKTPQRSSTATLQLKLQQQQQQQLPQHPNRYTLTSRSCLEFHQPTPLPQRSQSPLHKSMSSFPNTNKIIGSQCYTNPSASKTRSGYSHNRSPSQQGSMNLNNKHTVTKHQRPKSPFRSKSPTRTRSPFRPKTFNFKNSKASAKLVKAYQKKKQDLKEGEIFSPFLWRKFHIHDHMFDTNVSDDDWTVDKPSAEEIKDNIELVKLRYPHLTKYYKANGVQEESVEEKRERIFDKQKPVEAKRSNDAVLWQRHVEMLKASKSTSYYSFLSDYDRRACRACSHSKSCTSKHCRSCECDSKCDKHVIDVDFLKYRPHTDNNKETRQSNLVQEKNFRESKKLSNNRNSLDAQKSKSYGLTMQGFTIMPKTASTERKTLLSAHIDGQHCTLKSGQKKCLACAMAKENVVMQNSKRPFLVHPKSAPVRFRKGRRSRSGTF